MVTDDDWVTDWERRIELWEASLTRLLNAHLVRQERVVIEKLTGAKTRQRYDRAIEAKKAGAFGNGGGTQLDPVKKASLMARAAQPGRSGAASRATLTRWGIDWRTGNPIGSPAAPNTPTVTAPHVNGGHSTPNPHLTVHQQSAPLVTAPNAPSTAATTVAVTPTISGLDQLAAMGAIPRARTLAATVQAHKTRGRAWVGNDPDRQALADAAGEWIGDLGDNARYVAIRDTANQLAGKPRGRHQGPKAEKHARTLMGAAATGPTFQRLWRGLSVTDQQLGSYQVGATFTGVLDSWSTNRDLAVAFGSFRTRGQLNNPRGTRNIVLVEVDDAHGVAISPLSHATQAYSYLAAEEVLSSGQWEITDVSTVSETPHFMYPDGLTQGNRHTTVTVLKVRQIARGFDPDQPGTLVKTGEPAVDVPSVPMYLPLEDVTGDMRAANHILWALGVWDLVADNAAMAEVLGAVADPEGKIIVLDQIFDVAGFAKRLIEDITNWLFGIFDDFGGIVAGRIGTPASWNPRDPAVTAAVAAQAERMRGVATHTYTLVERRIADAEARGMTIEQVAEEVASEFARQRTERVPIIATTEVSAAANTAGYQAAHQSGATLTKTWITQRDERVRTAHRAADGQTRGVDERFDVGGFPMRFPHDPTAPPHLTVNCRCFLMWKPSIPVTTVAKVWSGRSGQPHRRMGRSRKRASITR